MYDEHDKRYHDDWRVMFHQLKERGRRLKEFTEREVEETDKIFRKLKGEYAKVVEDLEQLWKKYHAKRDHG
jgi:hypothetical protein